MGWTFHGGLPNRSRFVIIGAPHTSNWDFVVGILIIGALGIRVTWLAKHTLFRWPFGALLRSFGGVSVDRREHHGLVGWAENAFSKEGGLIIALTPEGTRKRTTRWKTGFYYIALGAGVPIVPVYLDYRHKHVGMGEPIMPTGDLAGDLKRLQAFYAPFAATARRPEHFGLGEDA